jgi:hypothetical protein
MQHKTKQTIHGAAFESVAAFLWTVLLLVLIGLAVSVMSGCETTGEPAIDFVKAGKVVQDVGEAVPPPVGSWIELVGVMLGGIGGLLAQEKRVRNRNKKIKELESQKG